MLVKVWNLNKFDHNEKFRDKLFTIKAGSYIQMDYHDAIDFLGQFHSPRYNKGGMALPESFKMLKIDEEDVKAAIEDLEGQTKEKQNKTFVCMLCSKEFATKKKLIKHVKDMHSDRLVDPEELESEE